MKRFLVGVVVGAVLVMGAAEGIPWPGDWKRAPMDAQEFTFLFDHGYCQKGYRIKRIGPRPSNNYACVSKKPQPGPPPP
jgi:hypothetical protein